MDSAAESEEVSSFVVHVLSMFHARHKQCACAMLTAKIECDRIAVTVIPVVR